MKNFSIQRYFLLLSVLLLQTAQSTAKEHNFKKYEYKFESIKSYCGDTVENMYFEDDVRGIIAKYCSEGWQVAEQNSSMMQVKKRMNVSEDEWTTEMVDYNRQVCLVTILFKRAINKKVANNQAAPISSDKGEDITTNP